MVTGQKRWIHRGKHPLEDYFFVSNSLPNLDHISIEFEHLTNKIKVTVKVLLFGLVTL